MSTAGRRENSSIVAQLRARPHRFGFVQAVRLLELASAAAKEEGAPRHTRNPVARYTPPATEVVRFHALQSLSFPSAEIAELSTQQTDAAAAQWHMRTTFMGLTGASGVLPYHYTELVLKRLKLKDRALASFLDLFNHRLISLFYQASIKYRLPLEYERFDANATQGIGSDSHTRVLLALIGLGTAGLTHRLTVRDDALLQFSGLLTSRVRSVDGLKQIIFSLFAFPVAVQEFVGQWQELIADVRSRLPGVACRRGQNNQLGRTVMLGRKGWFSQGKIRIVLGTLTKAQFDTLAPGTPTLKALDEIVQLYLNHEHDYEYVMRIRRRDVPRPMQLGRARQAKLAWDSWLGARPGVPDAAEATVDVPVSARRLL